MRVIEQESFDSLEIEASTDGKTLFIDQSCDGLQIDKQGAKQLIDVLKEFVGND